VSCILINSHGQVVSLRHQQTTMMSRQNSPQDGTLRVVSECMSYSVYSSILMLSSPISIKDPQTQFLSISITECLNIMPGRA
jgi:hypothetical protein